MANERIVSKAYFPPTLKLNIVSNNVRNIRNLNGYNAIKNVRNQVVQNAVQNPECQNGNGNVVAAWAEGNGNGNGNNGNQIWCYNCRGLVHYARNCTVRPKRRDAAYLQTQTQLLIAQKKEARIQL
ncbi:retrovirus-related pol polyprotein from transposon TNT 1-94 [Tanacetum coccineum]